MDGVTDSPDEDSELLPTVQRLLLDAQYHRAQVLVVGEVVPVLSPVEILLVGLLLDGGQLEALVLLPLLLDGGLLPRQFVGVGLLLNLGQLGVGRLAALAFVPDRVGRDLLPRALDPVARRRHQVVREFVAELVYGNVRINQSERQDKSVGMFCPSILCRNF